jgi:flagellar M-ring protein FliF
MIDQLLMMIRQLTVSQRIGVLFGAVFSVLLMVGLVVWAGQPQMTNAFTSIATRDAGTITDALKTAGIPYALADGGATIQVPSSQLAAARVAAGSAGYTSGAATGFEIFDSKGFGASDFDQQVTYQRALEGKLTNTILALDGVGEATVSIVAAKSGILSGNDQAATASVYVKMKSGQQPGADLVQGIVMTVSGAVAGLSAQNVTVVDADGTVLAGPDSVASSAATIKGTAERELAGKAQALLDSVLGVGKSRVAVTADLDLDKVEKQITTVVPISSQNYTPVSVNDQYEIYGGDTTGGSGGVPGSYSNVPGLPNYPTVPIASAGPSASPGASASAAPAASPGYIKRSSTVNFANSAEVDKITAQPGTVKRLSVAVLVDASVAKDQAVLTDLASEIEAAVGAQTAAVAQGGRGDVVQVKAFTFAAAAATLPAGGPDLFAMLGGMLPTVGGVLLSLALLFLVWRNMKALRGRAEDMQLAASRLPMPALSADAGGPGGMQAALAAGYRESFEIPDSPQAKIQERIRAVAEDQPDDIANLVTTWLREDEHGKRR